MTTVPCTSRYDVSGERCGEPSVRAYRSRFSGYLFRCADHLPLRPVLPWLEELPLAEAVVRSVMEKCQL